ncbi:MAG: TerB family tellurite resistance protein [Alphaproteobacteria bacterium]|nr:TerB family tellurite resistance protein [Alphaproteobacteria bacterium]
MGLFDMFRGDKAETMTPHLAFATSLIYCMGADGEMDNEEVGHLLSVLGGESSGGSIGVGANNRALLDAAIKYARKNRPDAFLREVSGMLTDAQKICILMNMIDSALSDGQPEREEQELINQFQTAFGISDERFAPFFQALMIKNDRTVFVNQSHPANAPGFQVSLATGR